MNTPAQWTEEERALRIGWEVSPQLRQGLSFGQASNDPAIRSALLLAGRATIEMEQENERTTDAGDRSPATHAEKWQPYAD